MTESESIRCLVVDDHQAIRVGVKMMLTRCTGIEVVGEAGDGPSAVALAGKRACDVILLDVKMPGMDGFQTAGAILSDHPAANICMFTAHSDRQFLKMGLASGARGYVLKDASGEELERAIRQVAHGGIYVDATLAHLLGEGAEGVHLSPRETEVMVYLAQGKSNPEIAEAMHLSNETVRTHVRNARSKLHATNRVQAVVQAINLGLIPS